MEHLHIYSEVFLVLLIHLLSFVQLVLPVVFRITIAPFDVIQLVWALVLDHLQWCEKIISISIHIK